MMDKTMEGTTTRKHFRPIFKMLRIGVKEYAVLDKEVANERALFFLAQAIQLIEQVDVEADTKDLINQYLLIACDYGSKDAAFLLASRVSDQGAGLGFPPEDVILFLKLAAERGHAEAAYELGCCYAATGRFLPTEQACADYFNGIDPRERQRRAEHFFHLAVECEHQEATEEIIIAYAYGRGYIGKSAEKFIDICERLIIKNNQSVALGYGAWLAGMTVEGSDPLPESIKVQIDVSKALDCLLQASRAGQVELGQHALHLISMGIMRGVWDIQRSDKLAKRLQKEIETGNQLLSLYYAWYSIPIDKRVELPAFMQHYQLTAFANFVEQGEEQAVKYLDAAFFGDNAIVSQLAKDILTEVFGRYFWEEGSAMEAETSL